MKRHRLEGVGEFEVRMELHNNIVKDINLMGDYFITGDMDGQLLRPLRGLRLEREALEQVLPERLDEVVMNLRRDDFIGLLLCP